MSVPLFTELISTAASTYQIQPKINIYYTYHPHHPQQQHIQLYNPRPASSVLLTTASTSYSTSACEILPPTYQVQQQPQPHHQQQQHRVQLHYREHQHWPQHQIRRQTLVQRNCLDIPSKVRPQVRIQLRAHQSKNGPSVSIETSKVS